MSWHRRLLVKIARPANRGRAVGDRPPAFDPRSPGALVTPAAVVVAFAVFLGLASAYADDFAGDWKFSRSDSAGAATADFDDASWQSLRLPHDWAIGGPFDRDAPSGFAAKLPWKGIGWYRKAFSLAGQEGRRVYLDFDGVMAFPQVFVNGSLAGEWDYGYTPFRIDATKFVRTDADNVLAIRVDTRRHGTRWYPGAGIYRKVAMVVKDQVHFAHWGIVVTTPRIDADSATVAIVAACENHRDVPVQTSLNLRILGPDGEIVAESAREIMLESGSADVSSELIVASPELWNVGDSKLYRLQATLKGGDGSRDEALESFGIRTIELTADDGLHVNGRRVQLHGVNLHHDHGPLGAAFFPRAMERQLEIMRDIGVNAIRTSHNPPARELLDLCDKFGLLVWDECFDKWDGTADRVGDSPPDLRAHAERHVAALVRRDRNHPCVFCWSIGNELTTNKEGLTADRVKMMREVVLKHDATRPVGIACHIPQLADTPIFDALDFTGWNYGRRYETFRRRHPEKPIIYSESASALSTRGFFEQPPPKNKVDYSSTFQVDSYDLNAAPWSDIADREFALMEQDRFVAGEFVWTGFDYLGEPTPFDREARSSYFGIVDLCGLPKDRYWLYRSYWRPETTTVHIAPHWNWPGFEGRTIPVEVYTNGDEAELFVNGKSYGRRRKGERPAPSPDLAANLPLIRHQPARSTQAAPTPDDPLETVECEFGHATPIRTVALQFSRPSRDFACVIDVQGDDGTWREAAILKPRSDLAYYGGREVYLRCNVEGKRLRVAVLAAPHLDGSAIEKVRAFATPAESSYYDVTYDYRLRWNDVAYGPGEVRAVAYRHGRRIGETVRRTAGAPARLTATPDRDELRSDGDDLCYVVVEAVDAEGNPCPLASNEVRFDLTGPATMAGAGNGDPLDYTSFQSPTQKLFFGQAVFIVRTQTGRDGDIHLKASSDGLVAAETTVHADRRKPIAVSSQVERRP